MPKYAGSSPAPAYPICTNGLLAAKAASISNQPTVWENLIPAIAAAFAIHEELSSHLLNYDYHLAFAAIGNHFTVGARGCQFRLFLLPE
jgi:hypothetical protein